MVHRGRQSRASNGCAIRVVHGRRARGPIAACSAYSRAAAAHRTSHARRLCSRSAVTSAHRTGSVPSQTIPVSPCRMFSRGPPASLTITGRPAACASRTTFPAVSVRLGKMNRSATQRVRDRFPPKRAGEDRIRASLDEPAGVARPPRLRDDEVVRALESRSTSAGSISSPSHETTGRRRAAQAWRRMPSTDRARSATVVRVKTARCPRHVSTSRCGRPSSSASSSIARVAADGTSTGRHRPYIHCM